MEPGQTFTLAATVAAECAATMLQFEPCLNICRDVPEITNHAIRPVREKSAVDPPLVVFRHVPVYTVSGAFGVS